MIRHCPSVFTTLTAVVGLCVCLRAEGQLSLQVKKTPADRNNVVVGASTTEYIGLLKNDSKSPKLVQIIQMPGRHGGNGRFGVCYLERWNEASREWDYVPAPVADVEPVEVKTVTLKPRSAIETCSTLLSQQPGQAGACYRFILQAQTKAAGSPLLLSRAFRTDERSRAGDDLLSTCGVDRKGTSGGMHR